MSLTKYHKKRRFSDTPEPKGTGRRTSDGGKKLRFVVQKHDASHLHYDFRIEVDGVLKSWAVPKGPSLKPQDKRLAMMVEDHPLEYRNFEGTIPEGNYGAGTVMIWDEGTYHIPTSTDPGISQKVIREELERGNIKLYLNGQKLKGEFALVKLKGKYAKKQSASGGAWLLIKHNDEFAGQKISNADLSVASGKTLEEIADQTKAERPDKRQSKVELKGKPKKRGKVDPRPKDIAPMLATLTEKAFDDDAWLFEVKWDGYRAIADVQYGQTKLYSRNQTGFNAYFPALVKELNQPSNTDVILDGEIVVVDDHGRPDFQSLQNYRRTGKGNLIYYVFDILYYNGQDLRSKPLRERKQILQDCLSARQVALPESDLVRLSEFVWERGRELLAAAESKGLEGIVAKRADSKYQTGVRNHNWLKLKTAHRQEFVIVGYTQPAGSRVGFGALALAVYEKRKLVYAGLVGTGFPRETLQELKQQLTALQTDKPAVADQPEIPNLASWVEPKLVAEVEFHGWTDDGLVRQASFQGLREDKNPRDVKREQANTLKIANRNHKTEDKESKFSDSLLSTSFSNLNKLFWPEDKVSKGDLIAYYKQISPILLPYLKGRPQNLNRFPHGIHGESFFQKNTDSQGLPNYVETINIYSESSAREVRYLVCQNQETLMYMGNLGCLEINPWNSGVGSIDQPDYVLFDLDPEAIEFKFVVHVAKQLHQLLDEIKAPNFIKTSGKRGLHVYVPLRPLYSFEQVQQFAELMGMLLRERLPDLVSLERSPQARQGRVYIDFLQNRKGQTTAGVYSPRPVRGATVSTPLDWDEVDAKLDPHGYTLKNIFKRLDKEGDLWKGMLTKSFDMASGLQKLGLTRES